MNDCITCARRNGCTKAIGFIFGECNIDYSVNVMPRISSFPAQPGDIMIYGANDKDHAIECIFLGVDGIMQSGELIVSASCQGGKIVAPESLFKLVKSDQVQ